MLALHFDHAADCALKLKRAITAGIKLLRGCISTDHHLDPSIIESINQGHEPASLVATVRPHPWHTNDDQCVKFLG